MIGLLPMENSRHSFLDLPFRCGPRPETSEQPPHVQLNQLPPLTVAEIFVRRVAALDFVASRQSRIAVPTAEAFWIPDAQAMGPPDAFLDDHEFCHIHMVGGGYSHLTLPPLLATLATERGWAEMHLLARAGNLVGSVHLLYAPRNASELDVAVRFVDASRDFARGVLS
jgi:hypothetical protein